jgi:hypothetical protein
MKRLIAAAAVFAAPLLLLGAAAPAEAAHCKCDKPGHHAKPAAKKHTPARKHARRHASRHHQAAATTEHYAAGGLNTYGWQRQSGHGWVAPGYGVSHGPGYGYVHEANREGGYARGYSAYDVQTYEYDSGWVPGSTPPMPPHGYGVQGQPNYHDSGWQRPGYGPCAQPGAVACLPPGQLPPGHPPVGFHGASYDGQGVKVGPEVFYGGLAGGVSGPESFGGFGTGGGNVVVLGSNAVGGGSAFAGARAAAFASASANAKVRGGRHGGGYGKGH